MYISWALLSDYIFPPPPPIDVEPQAEEVNAATDNETTQNVQFNDTSPGLNYTVASEYDDMRDASLSQDATLDEFFSRPIKLDTFSWGVGSTLFEEFDPWSLYFENVRVINRIANYKLMRAKLHIRVTINGNAFHYGRAILSYNPLPSKDTLTVDRPFIQADIVATSQRPHIYLNPTNSQGGDMVLPYFYYKNCWDITLQDWDEMGKLTLYSLQSLKHANGAVDTVSVNVFAWAEDVKFAIPTSVEPGSLLPQSDEYEMKPVSRIAGIVARAAGVLSKIPLIAPYARATEIGANALGAIATIFGYSRPVMIESCQYRPNTKSNLAVTNVPDDIMKLSVDVKQELTIDPRTTGLGGTDELAINYIASRESFLTSFEWPLGTSSESHLFSIVVDPGVNNRVNQEIHMPACCFAALPFAKWRGSMKYRFQIVCSDYHKGRLKIVYDPTRGPQEAEYNTAYTSIVDISDNTDFEIEVGWGQALSYRDRVPVTLGMAAFVTTLALPLALPYSSNNGWGNGVLSVYVVNELTVPNSTIPNSIEVNVFVSAGDDFEVAQPEQFAVSRMRLTPQSAEIVPQSDEMGNNDEVVPMNPGVIHTMAQGSSLTSPINHIHFGETIGSFRTMMKRYNLTEFISCNDGSLGPDAGIITILRPSRPITPGFTALAGPLTFQLGADEYVYGYMTLLNYITYAFGGWRGSTRFLLDASDVGSSARISSISVARDNGRGTPGNGYQVSLNASNQFGQQQLVNAYGRVNGQNGDLLQATTVNPTASFEVPYYSAQRFTPAKVIPNYSDEFQDQPDWRAVVLGDTMEGSMHMKLYSCAGEDYNCFFYLGPPIFYLELSPPS